jgi:acetyltransferase-like isoleucine patch superfamily enzyme
MKLTGYIINLDFMKNLQKYSLFELIVLLFSYFNTKIFYSNLKLIRLPFYIRGKKHIRFGSGFVTGYNCRIDALPINNNFNYCIEFGNNVQINDNVHIASVNSVIIGNNVLIASKVFISDHNHGNYNGIECESPLSIPIDRKLSFENVKIEDNVWIGESVCILPGVTIGEGSIIGSLSLVSKDIPPHCIAVGSPAKPIKKYNFQNKIWDKI